MLPEEVAELVIQDIETKKDSYDKNNLFYIVGIMGSGKTTFIKKHLLDLLPNYYYSNIDDYVTYFADGKLDSDSVYQLCRKVGIIVTDYILDNNISIILEGTGTNADIIPYLQRLKNAGYKIKTYFMRIQLGLCNTRVIARNRDNPSHYVNIGRLAEYHAILWDDMYKRIIEISDKVVEMRDNMNFIKG